MNIYLFINISKYGCVHTFKSWVFVCTYVYIYLYEEYLLDYLNNTEYSNNGFKETMYPVVAQFLKRLGTSAVPIWYHRPKG